MAKQIDFENNRVNVNLDDRIFQGCNPGFYRYVLAAEHELKCLSGEIALDTQDNETENEDT